MADPRISEEMIIDIGRRIGLIEDARGDANDDLKQAWSDAREELRALGLSGVEVSKEVALLKGAISQTRLDDADKTKRAEKAQGIESYVAILTSPRARARARRDKSEPLPPHPAAQEVGVQTDAALSSSGRTEPSADGQTNSYTTEEQGLAGPACVRDAGAANTKPAPIQPETATESLDDLAVQDGLKMSSDRKPSSGLCSEGMNAGSDQDVTGRRDGQSFDVRSLRPHCLYPDCCGGYGRAHCWPCQKAMKASEVTA